MTLKKVKNHYIRAGTDSVLLLYFGNSYLIYSRIYGHGTAIYQLKKRLNHQLMKYFTP